MAADAAPTFDELQRPLPPTSPRAWRFATERTASRVGALLSDGLRVGWKHGFDSGPFMAHVYANAPSGRTPLGRAIDRRLLARRTLVAFRDIRTLAEQAVLDAIDSVEAPEPVVADLAAGPAPYLLRALEQRPHARAILGDVDDAALDMVRAGARRLGVDDRVTCVKGDAFDRDALGRLDPRPDVVAEFGLYGIYHDNALIERHFRDLAECVTPRQILFNVQTQNPEIEHIARVWRNAAGERCVWRLRPVEQILDYASAAGYSPVSVEADRYSIYRVVRLARDGAA